MNRLQSHPPDQLGEQVLDVTVQVCGRAVLPDAVPVQRRGGHGGSDSISRLVATGSVTPYRCAAPTSVRAGPHTRWADVATPSRERTCWRSSDATRFRLSAQARVVNRVTCETSSIDSRGIFPMHGIV